MRHFNILETYCSPFVLKMKERFSMIKCMALSLTRKLKKTQIHLKVMAVRWDLAELFRVILHVFMY